MKIIYFDNAASGGYKPDCVIKAVADTLKYCSANPGRSGHTLAAEAAIKVASARAETAEFFGLGEDGNVIFTHNCTQALNYAILGGARRGHIITTAFEHNSVLRPLHFLGINGQIKLTVVFPNNYGKIIASDISKNIRSDTAMIIVNHISNVTGACAPIEEIGLIASKSHIPLLVDAAQSAGHIKINMEDMHIDILAAAGHKGLAAPQGVGVLLYKSNININPIIFGGTGTDSQNLFQPKTPPESLESGTLATPSIAGLEAGIKWVKENFDKNQKNVSQITQYLYEELIKIGNVIVYTPKDSYHGVISFNINGIDSGETANILNDKFSVCVRAGLHCAPLAHKYLKTLKTGAVRASISYQNTMQEAEIFVSAIKEIAKNI